MWVVEDIEDLVLFGAQCTFVALGLVSGFFSFTLVGAFLLGFGGVSFFSFSTLALFPLVEPLSGEDLPSSSITVVNTVPISVSSLL